MPLPDVLARNGRVLAHSTGGYIYSHLFPPARARDRDRHATRGGPSPGADRGTNGGALPLSASAPSQKPAAARSPPMSCIGINPPGSSDLRSRERWNGTCPGGAQSRCSRPPAGWRESARRGVAAASAGGSMATRDQPGAAASVTQASSSAFTGDGPGRLSPAGVRDGVLRRRRGRFPPLISRRMRERSGERTQAGGIRQAEASGTEAAS